MRKSRYSALRASLESQDEAIIIGAPQTLITVNDALNAIHEGRVDLDEHIEETEVLETATDAMESIAKGLRSMIRDGGMTPAIAQTHALAIQHALAPLKIDVSRQVVSHEAFANDRIAVSLEAERGVIEVLTDLIKRLVKSLRDVSQSIVTYLKSFSQASKTLNSHAKDLKTKVAALESDKVDGKQLAAGMLMRQFYLNESFGGDIIPSLKQVQKALLPVSVYTEHAAKVVKDLNGQVVAGKYMADNYQAMFKPLTDTLSFTLPGGYVVKGSADGVPTLAKEGDIPDAPESFPVPSKEALTEICNRVAELTDFIDTYQKSLGDVDSEIAGMLEVLEKEAPKTGDAEQDKLEALQAMTRDLKDITALARGCGPDFILYVADLCKDALEHVNFSVAQYQ